MHSSPRGRREVVAEATSEEIIVRVSAPEIQRLLQLLQNAPAAQLTLHPGGGLTYHKFKCKLEHGANLVSQKRIIKLRVKNATSAEADLLIHLLYQSCQNADLKFEVSYHEEQSAQLRTLLRNQVARAEAAEQRTNQVA